MSISLISSSLDRKLLHSLDELSFIEFFIAVDVVLLNESFKLVHESLHFLYSKERVFVASQTLYNFIYCQELITIDIESKEG